MSTQNIHTFIQDVLDQMPSDWIGLTTHRLDIYDESQAKTQFLEQFEALYKNKNVSAETLRELPTAYDYIRLGHPLSSVLEWAIAKLYDITPEEVISFSSQTIGILAVLRTNLLNGKQTQINYVGELPKSFNAELIKQVYGYNFELKKVENAAEVSDFNSSSIFITESHKVGQLELNDNIDFYITTHNYLGSILAVNGEQNSDYVGAIQHVRRRETIAMTPTDTHMVLKAFANQSALDLTAPNVEANKNKVINEIQDVADVDTKPIIGSSGLSVQYAIMMGLVHDAQENYPDKAIKFIVPPNCYGGTNDQARRVVQCDDNVEVVDLPVDGDNDMVSSLDRILDEIAKHDAIPYIIAEIPTNPRVEVPVLEDLKTVLSKSRFTSEGKEAVDSVFILDQTFCPNYHFLGDGAILSTVKAISYASGSKFPSGGKCTAGYAIANVKAKSLMIPIANHLELCDNEATAQQYEFLAEQMPSMNQRIVDAYKNTREFVNFIQKTLPDAKINFVSEELAQQGFMPSVFSLDLPTKGNSDEEREAYKRGLNLRLINMMITEIPKESKFCVSYGQLKGCYWTIPATSTQGTTKEGDKDYIVRASLSPNLDLEKHKAVFTDFVERL